MRRPLRVRRLLPVPAAAVVAATVAAAQPVNGSQWPAPPPPASEPPVLRLPPLEALLPRFSFELRIGVSDVAGGVLSTAFLLALFIAAQRVEDDARRAAALGGAVVLLLGLLLSNTGMVAVGAVALAVAAALALS